jgi:hypothetical protein
MGLFFMQKIKKFLVEIKSNIYKNFEKNKNLLVNKNM